METELEELKIRVANLEAERGHLEDLIDRLVGELSKARLGRHYRTLLAEMRLRLYLRSFEKPTPLTIEEQTAKLTEPPRSCRRSHLFDW